MKNRNFIKNSIMALLPILLGFGVLLGVNKKVIQKVDGYSSSSLPTTIDLNDTSEANIRSYYSSLNNKDVSERQGNNLLKNLKTILKNGQKYFSYESGENVWKMYEITDRDWEKSPASGISGYNSKTNKITGYTYNSSDPYVRALYVNRDVDNKTTAWSDHDQDQWGINREHVWPKAEGFDEKGAGGARGDPRHLMAGNGYANNIHSNYYYGYVKTSTTYTDCGTKYSNLSGNLRGVSKTLNSGTVFEPQDSDKGDIARSIFYMVARYNFLSGSDSDGIDANNPNLALTQNINDWSSTGYTSSTSRQGKLGVMTDLLAWHHADPVDEVEIHRNNLLYTNFTNNRNPFVDFPEWADFIWGSVNYNGSTYVSNDTTPTGYATPSSDTVNGYNDDSGEEVRVTGVTLNKQETSIAIGSDEALTATVAPANANDRSVTWLSSNTSVANVSSTGRVTAIAEGDADITVTTNDGSFSATCSVHVTTSSGGGGEETITWNKVTSLSDLSVGDTIIIANAASDYALSTNQASNNRTATPVTETNNQLTWGDVTYQPQELTLVSTSSLTDPPSNSFGLYTGNGYLYAASSSANYLKTQNNLDINGAFAFSFSDDASIRASKSSNNYVMRFNPNNNSPIFSCYSTTSSVGSLLSVYKKHTEQTSSKVLNSISLDLGDVKTSFFKWESFNYDGLSVTAHYKDLTEDIVVPTSVSTPSFSTTGTKTVTVTYTENDVTKTETYEITVTNPTLSSISVSNPKTDYSVGDDFLKPAVTATYNDSSVEDVTDLALFSGYNLSNPGNQTVAVAFTRNGTTKNTSYQIIVAAVSLESITISDYKIAFQLGDSFSFGGVVTAHYSNGSTSDVTESAEFSGYNMATTGNQIVTVTYLTKSVTYQINVSLPSEKTTYVATILPSDFTTTSYVDNNKSHEVTAVNANDNSDTKTVSFVSNQVMQQSSVIQFQKNTAFIYNSDSFGSIESIVINSSAGTFSLTYSDAAISAYTNSSSGSAPAEYFNISVGGATGKITSIVITFECEIPTTYTKVTNVNDLGTGDEIVFASYGGNKQYSVGQFLTESSYFSAAEISISGSEATIADEVTSFKVSKNGSKFSFATPSNKFIGSTTSQKMILEDEISANSQFTLTINNDGTIVMLVNSFAFRFNYNSGTNMRFTCYSTQSYGNAVTIYKKTAQVQADAWSSTFLTSTYNCNRSSWSSLASSYDSLSASVKGEIISCVAVDDSNYCKRSQAMARYEYILSRYEVSNFITGRNVSSAKPNVLPILFGKNANNVVIIIVVSLISVSAIGGYFFMKSRRKEEF